MRIIQIEVSGEAGKYEAMVRRIQEQNKRLYGEGAAGAQQNAAAFRVWQTSIEGIPALLRQIGAAAVAFKAVSFIDQFTGWAEGLAAVSKRTKIAVEDLNALERIVKADEGSFEELTTGFRRLAIAMSEAKDPQSEQAQLFKTLRIDVSQGLLAAFLQLADRMKDNLSVTDQFNVAQKLLGRSSENLINFLSRGGAAIRAQMEDMKAAGVITQQFAEDVDEARDQLQLLKDILSVKIGQPVVESLLEIAKALGIVKDAGSKLNLQFQIDLLEESLRRSQTGLNQLLQKFGAGVDPEKTKQEIERLKQQLADVGAAEGAAIARANAAANAPTQKDLINIQSGDAAKKAAELANKQSEELAKLQGELAKLKLASDEAARSQGDMSVNVVAASKAVVEQETAAQILALEHNQVLTPAIRSTIEEIKQYKLQAIDTAEADRKRKETLEVLKGEVEQQNDLATITAEAWGFYAKFIADASQKELEKLDIDREVLELEAQRLQMLGLTNEAEKLRLEATLKYIEAVKQRKAAEGLDTRLEEQKILNAQTALSKLGTVTIDIGGQVARTLDDIFTAMIQGTLKAVDVGKAAVNTVGRIATDIFSQTIRDKLKFELNLFRNVQQLPGQLNNAVAAGGGAGGLLQSLLFGTSGNATPAQGAIGPLLQSGAFFSQGSGVGGLFGAIGSLLQTPIGIGTSTIGSVGTAGLGGFLFGRLLGLNTGGQIGSSVGSLAGSIFGSTALGSTLGTGIGTAVGSSLSGLLGTASGTALGSMIGSSIFPVIGTIIGAILGTVLGNVMKSNPTAVIQAGIGAINFNEVNLQFEAGLISVAATRTTDISRTKGGQIADAVQQILGEQMQNWVNLLNLFPDFAKREMIPALEGVNASLNDAFRRLKFSEGGSRNIQEELQAFRGPATISRFFNAFLNPLSLGFAANLSRAGIPTPEGFFNGFAALVPPVNGPGFGRFAENISSVAALTGNLAGISPRGISQFLTGADLGFLSNSFARLFGTTDVQQFGDLAEQLEEQLKPVTEFLQAALQQTTDVFGRGLTAALEAATESDARLAFLNSLNTGIKDVVFQGLTQAFIASAQFSDLLAPIQQTIRQFTQDAIATGLPPDIGAFRSAILPGVESILGRADLLADLVGALQEFGFSLRDRLGLIPPPEPTPEPEPVAQPPAPTQFIVNLFGVTTVDQNSVPELARRLDALLAPQLAPRV